MEASTNRLELELAGVICTPNRIGSPVAGITGDGIKPVPAAELVLELLGQGWTPIDVRAAVDNLGVQITNHLTGLADLAVLLAGAVPDDGPPFPVPADDDVAWMYENADLVLERYLGPKPADKLCDVCEQHSISTQARRGPSGNLIPGRYCGDCWARSQANPDNDMFFQPRPAGYALNLTHLENATEIAAALEQAWPSSFTPGDVPDIAGAPGYDDWPQYADSYTENTDPTIERSPMATALESDCHVCHVPAGEPCQWAGPDRGRPHISRGHTGEIKVVR